MNRKSHSSSGGPLNLIIAVVIIIVVALGGFAVYRKVSDNILDRQIAEVVPPR